MAVTRFSCTMKCLAAQSGVIIMIMFCGEILIGCLRLPSLIRTGLSYRRYNSTPDTSAIPEES